ncbi:O-Methyltransferase involved in polyketide biosynthesis [Minicystis rosea]|nr:O-Methyltransferase involved in polyketide biosynthesis [Minicystis rosea]
MFPDQVSHTSLLTAAARAAESVRAERLFNDPFAAALAGSGGEALLAEVGPETAVPSIAIRTRFYDDVIRGAVARGIRQIVLLGAGLDTRAYRMRLPASVRWFEVDRAPVLDHKRRVLEGAEPTVRLGDIPGDACASATFDALRTAGLTEGEPVLWVVEGLVCFLGSDEIDALFTQLRATSGPGSEVLFDVPSLACVQATGEFSRAGGALLKRGLRFGTDTPLELARHLGIAARVVHEGHPEAHYGRRPTPPVPEFATGTWTVFIVHGPIETTSA